MKMFTYEVKRKLELSYGIRDVSDAWLEHAVALLAHPASTVDDVARLCAMEIEDQENRRKSALR